MDLLLEAFPRVCNQKNQINKQNPRKVVGSGVMLLDVLLVLPFLSNHSVDEVDWKRHVEDGSFNQ